MMKKLLILIPLVLIITNCSNSQNIPERLPLKGNVKVDINILLPADEVTVEIIDKVKQEPRQIELSNKLQAGVRNNYEWFVEYVKTVPQGQPMPYHKNFGLSKQEYKELQGFMNNIEMVSSGTEDVTVLKSDKQVEFSSEGKLSILNTVKIDLEKNIVLIGQYKLALTDTINVQDEANGLKSKWKGYTWRYEEPKDLDINSLKDISGLKAIQYKFTIGRLDKNGKTYMSIKGWEIESGAKKLDFEIPITF